MPLYNPGILATGGTVTGNLAVTGNASLSGTTAAGGVVSLNAGSATAGSAPVLTPTLSSGVAAQLADVTRDYVLYLTVGTAGTITVAVGPTSTPANTLVSAAVATSGEVISVRVPAGWYTKVTLVTATLASQTAIGC